MGDRYRGDNLNILRDDGADAAVDLISRGPPFNANRNANVLVKDNDRHDGAAQIAAFTDTRDWGEPAAAATAELRDRLHHAGGLGQPRAGPERPATG